MSVAAAVAAKDWREFRRDRRLSIAAVLLLLLALAAIVSAAAQVRAYEADRRATETRDRATWEGQGARNPHSVAHFSSWALRPLSAGALLDPGVTPYAGNAVWMEAHSWNPPKNRPVEDEAASIDLGRFSVAWLLQTLAPLLIFVVAAGLVARERERGTLRLMLASGAGPGRLLPAKLGGLARIAAVLLLPLVLLALLAAMLVGREAADPVRLLLWALAYLLYFSVVLGVAVAVSARARTVSSAMLTLVALWLLAAVLAPRAGAAVAERVVPTPSSSAFFAAVSDDIDKLSDAHGDDEAFERRVMARYGVTRREDLPVSIGGLQLDEGERVGNIAFDRHYGLLGATYDRQRGALRWAGLVSPLPALQNLSMALAGTDTAHQIDFQRQAEAHRRLVVGALNGDMIRNAGAAEFAYRAGPELWRRMPAFEYRPLSPRHALAATWPDALVLLGWALAAGLLVAAESRRLGREEA